MIYLVFQLNFSFEYPNYSNFKFKEQFSNYTDPRTKITQGWLFSSQLEDNIKLFLAEMILLGYILRNIFVKSILMRE